MNKVTTYPHPHTYSRHTQRYSICNMTTDSLISLTELKTGEWERGRMGRWNIEEQQSYPSLMVNQGELIPSRRFTVDRLQLLMCQRCRIFQICCPSINFHYTTLCFIIQAYIPTHPQYAVLHHITQSHVCINTHRHTLKHRYIFKWWGLCIVWTYGRWRIQQFTMGFFFVSRWSCNGGHEPGYCQHWHHLRDQHGERIFLCLTDYCKSTTNPKLHK